MKQFILLRYTLLCILVVCITACDNENLNEDNIPAAIMNDFSERFPAAEITGSQRYGGDHLQMDFIDSEQNQGSGWYANETWKMTQIKINDFSQLPDRVKFTFVNSQYKDAQIVDIYKTERAGMKNALYTFYFQFPQKTTPNVEHHVFISDDGLFLTAFTSTINDPRWFIKLPEEHFDYIADKYNGAEIRGYINNGGRYEYFIFHNGVVKFVFFYGIVDTNSDSGFWEKTRYELPADAVIPENIAARLKQIDPDFTYTNIYYIEAFDGNWYHFENRNHPSDLGYALKE